MSATGLEGLLRDFAAALLGRTSYYDTDETDVTIAEFMPEFLTTLKPDGSTGFEWHLMAEDVPPEGKGDYVILGKRGGKYYASSYNTWANGAGYFFVPNNRDSYKYAEAVKAWAVIPPLEGRD